MIVYVPGATFGTGGVVEPPPQADIPVMIRNAAKPINAARPLRFRFKGRKKTSPASATPNSAVESIDAVCAGSVEIESVKFAAVPPESAMVDGT